MGIVNCTPDSFSDGGLHPSAEAAVAHGLRLWAEGADWLDVGGESTRPGAHEVDEGEEIDRVVPVIAALHAALPTAVISVDTRKPAVAAAALAAGAAVVNDVEAARRPGMAACVASAGAGLVLMHLRGQPASMQLHTGYDDVVGEVELFLAERARAVISAGVNPQRIVVDAGLGFGKSLDANPALIAATARLRGIGFPVMVGASRKRFVGELSGVERPSERGAGSIGAALAALSAGADLLRVHDVAATIQAARVYVACRHA